jgi:hypothetical protein
VREQRRGKIAVMDGMSEVYLFPETPGGQPEFKACLSSRQPTPELLLAMARRRNHAMRFRYCFDS